MVEFRGYALSGWRRGSAPGSRLEDAGSTPAPGPCITTAVGGAIGRGLVPDDSERDGTIFEASPGPRPSLASARRGLAQNLGAYLPCRRANLSSSKSRRRSF